MYTYAWSNPVTLHAESPVQNSRYGVCVSVVYGPRAMKEARAMMHVRMKRFPDVCMHVYVCMCVCMGGEGGKSHDAC